MGTMLLNWFTHVFSLRWLTGPIFDKELRVSSRRRRNYVLRFVYIGLFVMLLGLSWLQFAAWDTSSLYLSSRMAQVGQGIMMLVIWFQFLAAQMIAIVMLSTAISDEIYHRTLGVLMTTPIASFQIVLGKLLSKLLQLLLLLAITLPLLAVVRVFGGVPWRYLVVSLCITLTTVTFVGSLSLLLSIFTRRAYSVIISAVVTLGVIFGLLPILVAFAVHEHVSGQRFNAVLTYVNPYILMGGVTETLVTARAAVLAPWPLHCAIMLAVSAAMLLLATVLVRRAALRQAVGEVRPSSRRRKGMTEKPFERAIRRVSGSPIFWKERRSPLLGRIGLRTILVGLATLGLLATTYVLCAREDILDEQGVHVVYAIVGGITGLLFTTVLSATAVTSEKESRTWSLLLTTTVGDWEILMGKLLGAVRRSLPAWLPLFGHVTAFTLAGLIHPVAILQLGLAVAWMVFFLGGTGLYFSVRLRHTTTAVIANVALAVSLWMVVPFLVGMVLAITRSGDDLIELYADMIPVVQIGVVTGATAGGGPIGSYDWARGNMNTVADATLWILLSATIYGVISLVFLARAAARLRKQPF